jgi:hypothetical protein
VSGKCCSTCRDFYTDHGDRYWAKMNFCRYHDCQVSPRGRKRCWAPKPERGLS